MRRREVNDSDDERVVVVFDSDVSVRLGCASLTSRPVCEQQALYEGNDQQDDSEEHVQRDCKVDLAGTRVQNPHGLEDDQREEVHALCKAYCEQRPGNR